ncbi:xanthine dehydrogenase family protein molybdopterin-binding subunit [Aliikangiella coralliicola]|uniref:Xanthine dehydrogenase family protein molybdopterin-binding subunit n=1 Tax=Aliikangiella coralliicola TaxID=2592383 RepID=A0A545UHD7_9GAMM|nr:molybdopterin cofactor-binding domain-containing protein [Aliikangiella coralliicola]TQV88875.1 xanthine dehydrogenase family protein molybdopterin-binding subunit [Aliikangiella coralliicola]
MSQPENPGRRNFIKVTTYAGVGLSLGFQLSACSDDAEDNQAFTPNAWLTIFPDNRVQIAISKVEMGQGILTAIPILIAEELEVDWSKVEVELAEASSKYGSMYTGGSKSIRNLWSPLRKAGATARELLIGAAANQWKVATSECYAKEGKVWNKQSGQQITFGELTEAAKNVAVPDKVTLKQPNEFNLIGKPVKHLDAADKVTGAAQFGIDVELPGLKFAAIKHAPVFGTRLQSVDESKIAGLSGVQKVVKLEKAVAVVADSYWQAQRALDKLLITWTESTREKLSTAQIRTDLQQLVNQKGELVKQNGTIVSTGKELEINAEYSAAFQAHAPMETVNCTVHVHDDGCDIWAPTQHPVAAQAEARENLNSGVGYWASKMLRKIGVSDNVRVFPTLVGGGFGRRLKQDYVAEAVIIAKQVDFPVKLIWSREEDIQHDFYRPFSYHKIAAKIDEQQNIIDWQHHAAGASKGLVAGSALSMPYSMAHQSLYFSHKNHGVPIGSWRSIASSHNAFVTECFIDEIAHSLKVDPLEFRLKLVANNRAKLVLENVARIAQWQQRENSGRALGIALYPCFGSYIAMVVEAKVDDADELNIDNIYCVADVGIVVNSDTVKAQIEGGIIFALNATVKHSIEIEQGRVKESNFDDYSMLRINEIPPIHINIINSSEKPGGVGEIAVPPLAPAVANAYFAATGKRLRNIPFL